MVMSQQQRLKDVDMPITHLRYIARALIFALRHLLPGGTSSVRARPVRHRCIVPIAQGGVVGHSLGLLDVRHVKPQYLFRRRMLHHICVREYVCIVAQKILAGSTQDRGE